LNYNLYKHVGLDSDIIRVYIKVTQILSLI